MSLLKQKVLTLLSCFFACIHLQAQPVYFENTGRAEGLSNNNVTCFLQDSRGLMWIGTCDGLNLFDAHRFIVFRHKATDSSSLGSIEVKQVLEDTHKNIWVLGPHTLSLFIRSSHTFRNYKLGEKAYAASRCILEDENGHIWLGGEEGLFQFNSETGALEQLLPTPLVDMCRKGNYFYLLGRGNILKFHPGSRSVRGNITEQFTQLGGRIFNASRILVDQQGNTWISTLDNGLIIADPRTETFRVFMQNQHNGLPGNCILTLFEDKAGRMWLGSKQGLLFFNTSDSSFTAYTSVANQASGLGMGQVNAIYEDKGALLWVGTSEGGISRLNTRKAGIKKHTLPPGGNINNPTAVLSFAQASASTYWIGTEGQGLFKWDKSKDSYRNYSGPFKNVYSIYQSPAGRVWLGTEKGLFEFTEKTATFNLNKLYSDTLDPTVRCMTQSHGETFWLGGNSGLVFYDPFSRDVLLYLHQDENPESISSNQLYSIFSDYDQALWIGGSAGLDYFRPGSKVFRHKRPGPAVLSIARDKKGSLWLALANSGLLCLDPASAKEELYNTDYGLHSELLQSVVLDMAGDLWLSDASGISCLKIAKKQFTRFDWNSGLTASAFMPASVFRSASGELFFGSANGFNSLAPAFIRPYRFSPGPLISSCRIAGAYLDGSQGKIELDYKHQGLEIASSVLDFSNASSCRYEYCIDNYSKQWLPAPQGLITLGRMPSGSYTLRVKAMDGSGRWSIKEAVLHIQVHPPFWKHWLFLLSILLLLIGFLAWFIPRKTSKIKNEVADRYQLKQLMVELEAQALKSKLSPRFIGAIVFSIQELLLKKEYEKVREYLSVLGRFMGAAVEYADLKTVSIDQEMKNIELYLELESLRLDEQLDFDLSCSTEIDRYNYRIPTLLIQPFVENAVWHGLKPKIHQRKLKVSFEAGQGQLLLCHIEDNGIGRKESARLKTAKSEIHRPMSVSISREKFRTIRKNHPDAGITIHDLEEAEKQSSGTRVSLSIPFYQ